MRQVWIAEETQKNNEWSHPVAAYGTRRAAESCKPENPLTHYITVRKLPFRKGPKR